jgi:hypothetical protein
MNLPSHMACMHARAGLLVQRVGRRWAYGRWQQHGRRRLAVGAYAWGWARTVGRGRGGRGAEAYHAPWLPITINLNYPQ